MKTTFRYPIAFLALSLLLPAAPATRAADYHLLKEIPVGGDGGWDYLSVDSAARRLYVTHGTKIVVIDLDKETVAGEITDTPGVHGFAIAPELGLGFSSNGREAKASVVELKTLKTTAKVETGQNPDSILFEPGAQEVYAFNGHGNSATVFEARTGRVTATIALSGKPEFCAADPKAGRVYVNIEDKNEIVVIDTKKHEVVSHWPIAPGEEASGMAYDAAHQRLFIECGNKLMAMIDAASGKVVATVPIGAGVDANAFDPGTQLAFSSNGEGTVTIAHEDGPDKLTVVQTLKTEPHARTMALDPATHKIYLANGVRSTPGSFKILVYGQ